MQNTHYLFGIHTRTRIKHTHTQINPLGWETIHRNLYPQHRGNNEGFKRLYFKNIFAYCLHMTVKKSKQANKNLLNRTWCLISSLLLHRSYLLTYYSFLFLCLVNCFESVSEWHWIFKSSNFCSFTIISS